MVMDGLDDDDDDDVADDCDVLRVGVRVQSKVRQSVCAFWCLRSYLWTLKPQPRKP